MTLFIYNHRLTGEQQAVEAQSIAEDQEILWSGKNWTEFEEETGLSEAEIGGLIKQGGRLVFSPDQKAESEKLKKPIATGASLVASVEKAFIGQSFTFRMQLQALFSPIKNTLLSETCNPLSISDFQAVFELLNSFSSQLTPEQILIFKNLLTEYVNNNGFFDYNGFYDYKPEVVAKITKKLKA